MWILFVSDNQQKKTEAKIDCQLIRVPCTGLKRIVRPTFKKLPEGYTRTRRAENRSLESGWGLPPEGKTFARTDFDPVTHQPIPSKLYRYVPLSHKEIVQEISSLDVRPRFTYTPELLVF